MSHGIHLISNSIPGYGRYEGKCLLCSRTSGVAAVSSYPSRINCNSYPPIKIATMENQFYGSKRTSLICSVNSNNPRRNPDFSRQNRQNHSFSRNKNRPNMEREKSENFEESEYLSSKNGPLLSLSNNPRYQATATPGPREKEIVELFRKVQAQLRARAAIKEEKKMDTSKGQGKETETVDSLLKLLRKHSVDQGKRRNSSAGGDFGLDQPEHNNSFDEENTTNFFESNNTGKQEAQEPSRNPFRRPASNFRRRSPVPRVKYQPVYSVEEKAISDSLLDSQERRKKIDEPEAELEPEPELDQEPDLEPYIAPSDVLDDDDDDEEFDVMSESDSDAETELEVEFSDDDDETSKEKVVETPLLKQQTDLSAMKLPELRALAKTRGVKGFYKLKKGELITLLSSTDSG